jgi:hypothetical protein
VKVWVVYEEYEEGSRNGEVVELLSAHPTEQAAQAQVAALQLDHIGECDLAQEEQDDNLWAEGWCACGLGFSYQEVEQQ